MCDVLASLGSSGLWVSLSPAQRLSNYSAVYAEIFFFFLLMPTILIENILTVRSSNNIRDIPARP